MENDKNDLFKKLLLNTKQIKENSSNISNDIDILITKLTNLKNSLPKKETDEVILNRWEELGFLEYLKEDSKLIIAHAFNLAAESIIYHEIEVSEQVEILVFPAIRVILSNNDNYLNYTVDNISKFVDIVLIELIESFNNDFEKIKERCALQNVDDVEAEFLHSFIDEYLKKHIEENLM